MSNRIGGTKESIIEQIVAAGERMKAHIYIHNWEAVRVDAELAARLEQELRDRHNERRVAIAERMKELQTMGWTRTDAIKFAQAEVGA